MGGSDVGSVRSLTETARLLQNVRSVFGRRSAAGAAADLELSREYPPHAAPFSPLASHSLSSVRRGHLCRGSSQHMRTDCCTCWGADGFAFSQEEGGTVSQADVIRAYDTSQPRATRT
ncbi:hypothetical protein RR46_05328 [Papilio xuthus]|uniref:Uncharacterized protein n=1 Tax=Papilio xuthus TaxID=66420 RepID=A0A194Q6A4_PAPXU|nr:hypothetical protein RR46_05328 [Papilio xuthus]